MAKYVVKKAKYAKCIKFMAKICWKYAKKSKICEIYVVKNCKICGQKSKICEIYLIFGQNMLKICEKTKIYDIYRKIVQIYEKYFFTYSHKNPVPTYNPMILNFIALFKQSWKCWVLQILLEWQLFLIQNQTKIVVSLTVCTIAWGQKSLIRQYSRGQRWSPYIQNVCHRFASNRNFEGWKRSFTRAIERFHEKNRPRWNVRARNGQNSSGLSIIIETFGETRNVGKIRQSKVARRYHQSQWCQ